MVVRISSLNRNGETSRRHYPISPFRMFEDFFNDWAMGKLSADQTREDWIPPADVLESDGNMILKVQIPGVSEKDVNLQLEGSVLTISGEKKLAEPKNGATYRQSEIFYGRFTRTFSLPETVDTGKVSASFKNGILTVSLPSRPEIRPRTIKISTQ